MSTNNDRPQLYLIGFRTEPDIYDPQLYTIYVDDERPILYEGKPIFFSGPERASAALAKSTCGAAEYGPAPSDLQIVYDITDAVYTIATKNNQDGGELLNFLNIMLDFANCIGRPVPDTYRSVMEQLADHLTFNSSFVEFLKNNGISRETILDAIYWTLGMIVCEMRLII